MRKDILNKKLARLLDKKDKLSKRNEVSENADELRSIGEQLADLNAEIEETREEIAALEEETRSIQPVTAATTIPEGAKLVNGNTVASFTKAETERKGNVFESMEYREAIKRFVQKGEETRSGDVIVTKDTDPAIPFTVVNEVINMVRTRYGSLYRKVRKEAIQGGMSLSIGELEAEMSWVTEDTVSPTVGLSPLEEVRFSFYGLSLKIAQSMLSSIVTLTAFEAKFAEIIARAYLKKMDYSILNGTGNGQMLGIFNDPRVLNNGQIIEMTEADFTNWKAWRQKLFANIEPGYEDGEFIFTRSTVESQLLTMSDANNNPLYYQATGLVVNSGDAINPDGYFYGREISIVPSTLLKDFINASNGDYVGVYWIPEQSYVINENYGFTVRRYYDENRDMWINKAMTVVDGKPLNPKSIFLIKKKA